MASPELERLLQVLRAFQPKPGVEPSIDQLRKGLERMTSLAALPSDLACQRLWAHGVPVEWIETPQSTPGRVILYLHGGGYVMGSVDTHKDLMARLARSAGARVLGVDYRLAPEHPFPAALDDARQAYRWLLEQGIDPRDIVIAGDSAGGGLTVATLVSLRDLGAPLPAAAACLSPWVDLEGTGESMTARAHLDPMIRVEPLRRLGKLYLAGTPARHPLAAPMYADLKGLPPMLIQVGTAETLHDDAARLAERARRAGVEVILEPWDEMIHVWHAFASILPEGQKALDRIGAFVREKLG